MAPATTGSALDRRGDAAMLALKSLQADIAAVPEVDIDHDKAGDRTGYDTDPSVRHVQNHPSATDSSGCPC